MATPLARLAELVGGAVVGDGAVLIDGAATLDDVAAGQITLIDGQTKVERLLRSPAAAAVVPEGASAGRLPAIVVGDVHCAFAAIVVHFRPQRATRRIGISPQAVVASSARLAADVDVHPWASVGEDVEIGPGSTLHSGAQVMAGCRLGAGVTLMPGAVLYENTLVGPGALIHAGAVIGAHGFGYVPVAGRHQPCAQLGNVVIGADVEIGANTTVDRGTYGPTTIGEGTKIDNLVMIGHNCRIGRHNIICSQVGIAGSTTTGDYVVLAGQVGVRDHVHIGRHAVVGARAGVSNDVPDGAHVLGAPAIDERDEKLQLAAVSKLPQMRKEFKSLKRAVDQLLAEREPTASSAPTTQLHARAS